LHEENGNGMSVRRISEGIAHGVVAPGFSVAVLQAVRCSTCTLAALSFQLFLVQRAFCACTLKMRDGDDGHEMYILLDC